MKATKNRSFPLSVVRYIKPKSQSSQHRIPIDNISFSTDEEKNTYIFIYPSQTWIESTNLLQMIEAKKERIPTRIGHYVLREELLHAIYNSCDEDKFEPNLPSLSTSSIEPKRPTNAFILYRTALGKKVKLMFPKFSNSDTSKFIGAMWKASKKEVRERYINQAENYRKSHKEKYPNFEYNTKKISSNQLTPSFEEDPVLGENFENYFDFYYSSVDNQDNKEESSTQDTVDYSWNNPEINICINNGDLDISNSQSSDEWSEVCKIVSRFFPDDSDQNSLVDENLWESLENSKDHKECANALPFHF